MILMVNDLGEQLRFDDINNKIFNHRLKNYFEILIHVNFFITPSFERMLRTVSEGCAPLDNHSRTRSSLSVTWFLQQWVVSTNCFDETSITWSTLNLQRIQ